MKLEVQQGAGKIASTEGVDVGRIEKELALMWQRSQDGNGSSSHEGMTRTCVLNLIVYATEEDDTAELNDLLNEVIGQNPCRALVLMSGPENAQARLEASVATRCHSLPQGSKQICGEQVTFEASGPALHTISSAIEPLLVPDVPVFLWWKDIPHYEDKLFNRLADMSDRVVIDSLAFDHPHEDLLRLVEIIREHPQFMRVSDLNWGRLTSWRTLIASFWDVPEYIPCLEKINRLVVEYQTPASNVDHVAAQAYLLLGWLASRLGWSFDSVVQRDKDGKMVVAGRSKQGDLETELRPVRSEKSDGGLLVSLRLFCDAGNAEFYVGRSPDGTRLETSAKTGEKLSVGRVLSYEEKTEGQRLSREVGILGRDVIYEQTATRAADLITAIESSRTE